MILWKKKKALQRDSVTVVTVFRGRYLHFPQLLICKYYIYTYIFIYIYKYISNL